MSFSASTRPASTGQADVCEACCETAACGHPDRAAARAAAEDLVSCLTITLAGGRSREGCPVSTLSAIRQ